MRNRKLVLKNKKRFIISVVISALTLFLIFFAISVIRDIFWTDSKNKVSVEIPANAGMKRIAEILEEKEIIDYPFMFRVYEKLSSDRVYMPGTHTFYEGMSYGEILDILAKKDENAVTVTIPEGYELRQIAQLMEKNGICSESEFYKASNGDFSRYPFLKDIKRTENPLEGYLFPATYEFRKGQDAKEVIDQMLKAFDEKVYSAYKKSKTDKSLDEIIIMASVVEREAANDSERGKVASVFYNRLAIGMKLQSCATVQYILEERKAVLSDEDIKIDSVYNTYMYAGLPAGPIASPGLNSVMAAINPEQTDYLYFAATADGSQNVFSKTGEDHMQLVEELQR